MRKYFPILCLLSFVVGSAHGVDSTVTITGYLKENTCSVSIDSQGATVDLTRNSSKQFILRGDRAPAVPFKILLNECGGSVNAVKVGYVGVQDINASDLLKIDTNNDAASGVGIQILDREMSPVPLNAMQESLNWISLTPNQSNVLDFYARLEATGVPVIPGIVTATANFTLEFQ